MLKCCFGSWLNLAFLHTSAGQDLLAQHSNPNGAEMNGSIRLASPLNSQPANATLTITNDHLLPQSPANTGMAGQSWYWCVCGLYLGGLSAFLQITQIIQNAETAVTSFSAASESDSRCYFEISLMKIESNASRFARISSLMLMHLTC